MQNTLFRIAMGAALALVACRHQASTTAPATPPSATLSQAEMVDLCVNLHTNVAACPLEFTKMNLDLRAKYSPEFAQMMQDPAMRQAAETEGAAETKADAANARAQCSEFAKPEWGAPQPRTDLAKLDACYAMTNCAAQMQCIAPIVEPRFAYRAAHGQPGQH